MVAWSRMLPSSFGVGVAPLPGGLAEEGDVQQVGLAGVGDGGLRGRDLRRDEVGLDGVGVDAVVELGEGAVEIPGERKAAAFVLLEPLEFLDEVELELDGDPRGELEGDVLVGVGAAVAPALETMPMAPVRSIHCFGSEDEAVQPGLHSNPVEFDGIKTGVVELLPDAEELDGVPIAQPVAR